MTTGPGDDLAELLWDHGPALLRRAPAAPPPLFQPFTCSAAGSSRSQELKRHAADAVNPVPLGMHGHGAGGLGLGGLPVVHDDDDDAVPWLHCPVVDDGDADTAPLPPEYCASLLPDYSEPEVVAPLPASSHAAAVVPAAPPHPEAAAKLAPPSAAAGGGGGEGVVNFTFFSRPLQRPQATARQPVESTVVQAATTNRLRSTPLFSEQRMAWLQPPKAPRAATVAAAATAPPPPPPPLTAPLLPDSRRGETVAQPLSTQPEARPPDAAAAVTTSSVCSGNGHRGQLKRSNHLAADCSVSPDEDLDDEPGVTRRSAAGSAKRSRTAEVHNLSERRRRDRINEKMRALQELIPNCNKIDKASMLEEAIEYLKTLQLQVQMMSMGTGLCMPMPPPAMLLPAMHQHMQALPLHHHPMAHAHFPHLGIGLGYGMGMGAAAAGYDMLPRVAAGAPHFPCPPMAMPPPGAMFGVPGQGMASLPAAFAHMAGAGAGIGAAPAAQMEAAAAAAPARPGEAEHPPVRGVTQGDQEAQHPKQM